MSDKENKPQENGQENNKDEKKITMEQLKEHNTHEDLWLMIDGNGRS